MNKVYWVILVILTCAALCLGQAENRQKGAPLADEPQKSKQVTLVSGTNITAELQKTIDVNNAKTGDSVMLKTTKTIRQDGEVVVPRGTQLLGRITDVRKGTK